MWANYAYFMKAVLPVAEQAGVKLALHPDDPPVPELGGIARLFYNAEGFKKAMEVVAPSPNHGLDFCMGCFSEMGPGGIEAIRYFGQRGKIFYFDLRAVQCHVAVFQAGSPGAGNVAVIDPRRTREEVGCP